MTPTTTLRRTPLDDTQIRALAPSVFATARRPGMSERYAFISTAQVLTALRAAGFVPVAARQAGAREAVRAGYTRHVLTFRQSDAPLAVGDHLPEIVLCNAHDGSAAYKLLVGVFRLVCANGLIVAEQSLAAIRVAHRGARTIAEVVAATQQLVSALPAVLGQIERWRATVLSVRAQRAYAQAALQVRYPNQPQLPISAEQLLAARRPEDAGDDLWRVFNRVQEHLVLGGLAGQLASGRRTTTRPIAAVTRSLALNQALWALTAQTAEQHDGAAVRVVEA